MRPPELRTKIFLDSGDPAETRDALDMLGFLDGQTTNPTLIAKNPYARERFDKGEKFTEAEIYDFYHRVVSDISELIPDGSVSIEVHAEAGTTADEMFEQGQKMFGWIPNAHIKYPATAAGLEAAGRSVKADMRVNLTLCFSQEQAAAVYAATAGAAKGNVFVSPFIGRLDDIGQNGMDLIANVLRMYQGGDGHVEVLAASVRTQEQFMQSLALGADIITAPLSVLEAWVKAGKPLPDKNFIYDTGSLQPIAYRELDMAATWQSFDLRHELTDKGIERFSADWRALIG